MISISLRLQKTRQIFAITKQLWSMVLSDPRSEYMDVFRLLSASLYPALPQAAVCLLCLGLKGLKWISRLDRRAAGVFSLQAQKL